MNIDLKKFLDKVAKGKNKELLVGGEGDNRPLDSFKLLKLAIGTDVEYEHTNDMDEAMEIAMDHLTEEPDYYDDSGEAAGKELGGDSRKAKRKILEQLKKF